jgi:hypothetical protein
MKNNPKHVTVWSELLLYIKVGLGFWVTYPDSNSSLGPFVCDVYNIYSGKVWPHEEKLFSHITAGIILWLSFYPVWKLIEGKIH